MFMFGAVLVAGAVPVLPGASHPATAQSSTVSKKKKTASSKSKKRPAKTKGQLAPAPDRIKEIQTALQKDGSYQGEPTGKWDQATSDAMRKYQDKNGFPATGKIDAQSLNKLGLGSDTAGKGAPTPSASTVPHSPLSPSANPSSAPAASALPADPAK